MIPQRLKERFHFNQHGHSVNEANKSMERACRSEARRAKRGATWLRCPFVIRKLHSNPSRHFRSGLLFLPFIHFSKEQTTIPTVKHHFNRWLSL